MLLQVKWAATFILSLSYCHHHHHHYHHYQDLRKACCCRSNGRLLQPVHLGGILRGSHGRRRRRCRCTTNRTGIYSSSSTILLCCLLFVFLCTSIQQTFFFFFIIVHVPIFGNPPIHALVAERTPRRCQVLTKNAFDHFGPLNISLESFDIQLVVLVQCIPLCW